jgi:hypothetical protein
MVKETRENMKNSIKRTVPILIFLMYKEGLKMPKPEATNRRADNTIANRKRTTNAHKTLHRNVRIAKHEPH